LEDKFAGSEDQFAGLEDQFAGMTDTTGLEITNGGPSGDDRKPEYGRPVSVRKSVERLVMSFKGKKYGTTMVQVNAEMGGMSAKESVNYMESELVSMGADDTDAMAVGIILAHMLVKKLTLKFGVDRTLKVCMA